MILIFLYDIIKIKGLFYMNGVSTTNYAMASLAVFLGSRHPTLSLPPKDFNVKQEFFLLSIVLLDLTQLCYIDKLISYAKQNHLIAEIHLCDCLTSEAFPLFVEMKKQKIINNIFVSMDSFYYCQNSTDFYYGCESWKYYDKPSGLRHIYSYDKSDSLSLHVKKVLKWILDKNPKNELEKIILMDIWMQKNIQYADKETKTEDCVYYCPSMSEPPSRECPLIYHYGVCEDIAFTAALILNHPLMQIHCRHVSNGEHSWNIVSCMNKEYHIDFTHNITRNPDKVPGILKAKSYTTRFTLVGGDFENEKYGYSDYYPSFGISKKDFDRELIEKTVEYLRQKKKIETEWESCIPIEQIMRPREMQK